MMPGGSYLPSNLSPVDSADFSFKFDYMKRHPGGAAYSRFGMLADDSMLQERMRSRGDAPGGNWGYNTGSGSVRMSGFGGGSTPTDPGGHNWRTLKNVSAGAAQGFGGLINASRTIKRASDQNKARQWQNTQRAYTNAWDPNMNYSYAYQQAASGQQNPTAPGQPTQQGAAPAPKFPTLGAPGTMPVVGPVSNIKNPQNPIEAANKGIMEWRKGKLSSKYPNPTDPSEAANKGVGDMLRAQHTKAEAARLTPAELYKANKSMREMFPNFYKNK